MDAKLNGALGSPSWWAVTLPTAGGLELNDFQGRFQISIYKLFLVIKNRNSYISFEVNMEPLKLQ